MREAHKPIADVHASLPIKCRAWQTNPRPTCTPTPHVPHRASSTPCCLCRHLVHRSTDLSRGQSFVCPYESRAPDSRAVPPKCTGDYTATHAAARESSVYRNAAGSSRLYNAGRVHAPELPDAATEHIRGGVQVGPGGGSERGRRGHSRTRAKSLVCHVRPPVRPRATAAAPLRPSVQRQRAQPESPWCRAHRRRHETHVLSSSTNKHSVSVTQAMRQLRAHCKHLHFPCKRRLPVSDPLRCTLHTDHCTSSTNANKCLQAVQRSNSSKDVPSPFRDKHRILENTFANWSTAVRGVRPFSGNGRGGRGSGGDTGPAAEHRRHGQHSPRSKRLGGSTPRHSPHRPYRFAAYR